MDEYRNLRRNLEDAYEAAAGLGDETVQYLVGLALDEVRDKDRAAAKEEKPADAP